MPVSFLKASAHLAYIGNGKVAPAPVMSAAKAVPTALLANVTAMTATVLKNMRSGFIKYLSTGVNGTGRTLGANDDNSVTVGPRPPRRRPHGADSSPILSPICHEAGTQWRGCPLLPHQHPHPTHTPPPTLPPPSRSRRGAPGWGGCPAAARPARPPLARPTVRSAPLLPISCFQLPGPRQYNMRNGTRLAAVDLGSNSFRLEIGRYEFGHIQRVEYLKETVRPGNGLDEDQQLTRAAMERGWACLARFGERLAGFPRAQVRAVATQTLREARNREEFLSRGSAVLASPIDVVSGAEEARLIYQGVARLLPQSDERRLVVDIGGRSTELILGQQFSPQAVASYQVGSVAWSQRYFAG